MVTTTKVEAGDIEAVRDLILQVARDQAVPDDEAEGAREIMRAAWKEAASYGLTTAEVIRAICRPVLESRSRGCNCPTCALRKQRLLLVGQEENA